MADEEINLQEYGKLVSQVAHLTKSVDRLEVLVTNMNDLMQQSKGGYKTLAWLGGIAGVAGAALTWILTHIKVTP